MKGKCIVVEPRISNDGGSLKRQICIISSSVWPRKPPKEQRRPWSFQLATKTRRSKLARTVFLSITEQDGSETRLELPKNERQLRNIYQRGINMATSTSLSKYAGILGMLNENS